MKNTIKLDSFEECCSYLKLDAKKVIPDFSFFPKNDIKAMISHSKIIIIVKANNKKANNGKEWFAKYGNPNTLNYEPFFNMNDTSSPLGFSFIDVVLWRSLSFIGSRLCFISEKLCRDVVTRHLDLFRDYYVK